MRRICLNFSKSCRFAVLSGFASKNGTTFWRRSVPLKTLYNEQVFFMVVVSAISVDASTSKEVLEDFKNLDASFTLNNRKPRLHLPSQLHAWISLNWAAKAAFSVDEADDPLLDSWPFLLIVRTGRVVTTHTLTLRRGCDTTER
jgi:hypothetical protein